MLSIGLFKWYEVKRRVRAAYGLHILLRFGHDTSSCRVLTGPQQAHLATRCRVLTGRHGTPRGSLSGPLSQTFQFPDSIPGLSKIPVTASEQITMPESVTREEAATVHRSQMECRYRWEIKGRVPRECRHCETITTEAPIQCLNSIRWFPQKVYSSN